MYNILVRGYCKMGWLKEAPKVIELMVQDNCLPDVWTWIIVCVMFGLTVLLLMGFVRRGRLMRV